MRDTNIERKKEKLTISHTDSPTHKHTDVLAPYTARNRSDLAHSGFDCAYDSP